MALAERYEEDRVEIVGAFRTLQVRTARIITDTGTGEELARTYHREALTPDADVSGQSALVRGVAAAAWTPEIRDRWAKRPRPEVPAGPPAR